MNKLYKKYLSIKYENLIFGKDVEVDYNTVISIQNQSLILEKKVLIRSNRRKYHAGMPFPSTLLIDIPHAYIKIGENSRINGCYIHAQRGIEIGRNCVIASGTNIIDSNGHQTHSINRTLDRDVPKEIVIGNNVWIGINSVILKGTVIGDNSIVGAGSIVKGTFEENSIIIGNPAKVVGKIRLDQ